MSIKKLKKAASYGFGQGFFIAGCFLIVTSIIKIPLPFELLPNSIFTNIGKFFMGFMIAFFGYAMYNGWYSKKNLKMFLEATK